MKTKEIIAPIVPVRVVWSNTQSEKVGMTLASRLTIEGHRVFWNKFQLKDPLVVEAEENLKTILNEQGCPVISSNWCFENIEETQNIVQIYDDTFSGLHKDNCQALNLKLVLGSILLLDWALQNENRSLFDLTWYKCTLGKEVQYYPATPKNWSQMGCSKKSRGSVFWSEAFEEQTMDMLSWLLDGHHVTLNCYSFINSGLNNVELQKYLEFRIKFFRKICKYLRFV